MCSEEGAIRLKAKTDVAEIGNKQDSASSVDWVVRSRFAKAPLRPGSLIDNLNPSRIMLMQITNLNSSNEGGTLGTHRLKYRLYGSCRLFLYFIIYNNACKLILVLSFILAFKLLTRANRPDYVSNDQKASENEGSSYIPNKPLHEPYS